jgi:O-acetyl-ADP-ribose deacetylase (regulator of RNase III)
MHISFGPSRLELVQGDITLQAVDAIVNAANARLAGGGGVDGAIHRAGGPAILEETRRRFPDGCPTGSAVATTAGSLPARYVFHAVGPVWQGGRCGEPELLATSCRACLKLAVELKCDRIALPAISTGAYGYPVHLAAANLLKTSLDFIRWHQRPALVRFVLFDESSLAVFSQALKEITK